MVMLKHVKWSSPG